VRVDARVREPEGAHRLCRAASPTCGKACPLLPSVSGRLPAFVKRRRLLSTDQYEIVDVRTSRGVRRAMLFPKAILEAEWAADAPFREALAIKRERLRAKRAAKQRSS
jgi:hypothetical protein